MSAQVYFYLVQEQNNSYLWYMNPYKRPLTVHFMGKDKLDLDPMDYVIGFVMPSADSKQPSCNTFNKPKILVSSTKGQKVQLNNSLGSDRLKYSNYGSTRMSMEEVGKYQYGSEVKPRGDHKVDYYTERKVPPLEI